jgi:hypothetical protein
MCRISRLTARFVAAGLLVAASATLAQEASFEVSGRYTAQRKPRITVLKFEDANAQADRELYGSSVEAMIVTFLKRKSQFVVVERQRLGDVYAEWQRNQLGQTNMAPDDPARQLLEKVDLILVGSVTLLDAPAKASVAEPQTGSSPVAANPTPPGTGDQPDATQKTSRRVEWSGQRVEIDAKLLSRVDGRIIAAAERRGPVSCLRSIVERLGIELEQSFLRPYYGKLQFSLSAPDRVQVYLTPILLETAVDEEKPPIERGASVLVGGDFDTIQPWVTNPRSYTVENLLSGWYSIRLERPGYEAPQTDNARWVARNVGGRVRVYDQVLNKTLSEVPANLRRFVVHVDPMETEKIDADSLQLTFKKKGGSITPQIRRQFLDPGFTSTAHRVLLYGDTGLEINRVDRPKEYAEDATCDLFEEERPTVSNQGATYVAAGQPFSFESFTGGRLLIEDYRGEAVPAGQYQMVLWEPEYQPLTTNVNVQDQDRSKPIQIALLRKTQALDLTTTGPRNSSSTTLTGEKTGHRIELPLSFDISTVTIPIDRYTASTAVPGLSGWHGTQELLSPDEMAPVFDLDSKKVPPIPALDKKDEDKSIAPTLRIKTRFVIGGRLDLLSELPRSLPGEIYLDRRLGPALNSLLPDRSDEEDENPGFWHRLTHRKSSQNMAGPPASLAALAGLFEDENPASHKQEILLDHLEALLSDIDLLVLSDQDMDRLRSAPQAAALISDFVSSGGSLFAFVSEEGDYSSVFGSPLEVTTGKKKTRRFDLLPGQVAGIKLPESEKKIRVKSRRRLPQVEEPAGSSDWRTLAFSRNNESPRILEKGSREQGGFIALWFDHPDSFRGRKGKTVPEVEAARAAVERHVIGWSRYLMYRRYDTTGNELRKVAVSP